MYSGVLKTVGDLVDYLKGLDRDTLVEMEVNGEAFAVEALHFKMSGGQKICFEHREFEE